MKNKTKIFTLIIAYFCLMIFDSCSVSDDGIDCGNINAPPFYDFKSLIISPNQNEISNGEKLELTIQLDELEYLTFVQPKFSFGLLNKAYGCTPLPPGYDGPKFPIATIEVSSNQDFNSDNLANSLLNKFITLRYFDELIPLDQANIDQLNFIEADHSTKGLILETTPDSLNIEHTFTIKITKSNGEIIENSVSGVVWN